MDTAQVLLTSKAAQHVLSTLHDNDLQESQMALRILAIKGGCSGYKYQLDIEELPAGPNDSHFQIEGINLVVDKTVLEDVIGSVEIDYQDGELLERGFKFRRLSTGAQCGCGESFEPIKP